MASHTFMMGKKPTGRHTQPLTHSVCRPKVFMTPETRAVLSGERRNRARKFQDALDAAWHKFDEVSQTLALKHRKSLRRVQNELHLGHGRFRSKRNKINAWNAFSWKKNLTQRAANEGNAVGPKQRLSDVVKQNALEYQQLSQADKLLLIEEFREFRNDKTTGMRITARSKVNDITHTLGAVENELRHLKSRTGVEAIFYATRGTTDLPLRGIAFATEGVEDFMGSVMGMETQDVVSKMEGYAVQGIKGKRCAAQNHQQRVSSVRSDIRRVITERLQQVTGDPRAKMEWRYYFRNIVSRYRVVVEGWPTIVPFVNLSLASSSLSVLEMLLRKWELGSIYWKTLTDGEYNELRKERDGQIERGEITEPMRRPRSDKGTKRARCSTGESSRSRAKTYKSAATVDTDDDDNEDPVNNGVQALTPLDSTAYPLHQGNETASSSTQPPLHQGNDTASSSTQPPELPNASTHALVETPGWQGGINDNFVGTFLDGEGHIDDFMWPLDSMRL
ncbi:hypothetical protein EDD15DRAFT_2372037 [Pisolithus albus]|nr:hypothetical protein EDD15DRAFT_2372037 [Pisolithus albus]